MRLFDVFKNAKIFDNRIIYKIKRDLNDVIERYKTKCVVREFEQQTSIDFIEIYATIIKIMSFKILFVIVAHNDYDCEQRNILIVFLNNLLSKTVYVYLFEEYDESYV